MSFLCRYFINLCHGVNDGPIGCGNDVAVCRQRPDGTVQLLGKVDSQSMAVKETALTGMPCTSRILYTVYHVLLLLSLFECF